MKKYNILFVLVFLFSMSYLAGAQVLSNGNTLNQYSTNNVFFDGSSNFDPTLTSDNNNGKGLLFPRTDLTLWVWLLDDMNSSSGFLIPGAYDGMIVFNTGTGPTPTGAGNPIVSTDVVPGFYYFSNPTVDPNNFSPSITDGRWIPIGSAANNVVKSKTVIGEVPANATTATLDVNGLVTDLDKMAPSTVNTFLGAKIYNAAGDLVMTADAGYDKVANVITTGNGMMYQVLPQGIYTVIVDYK